MQSHENKHMSSLNILVVDDSKVMRDMLRQQLEEYAYETRSVVNGDEAIAILQKESFDVIITDLMMPGKTDGIRLLEVAKQFSEDLAVIVITGHASVETAIGAMKKGAAEYLTKPFKLEQLLINLDKIGRDKEKNTALKAVELQRDKGISDLKDVASNLYNKVQKVKKTLTHSKLASDQRIVKALKILDA